MARIRTIKPEFWEDEVIGTLSLGARLLFIATWNYADDEGLIRWSPAHLKSVAFRYDNNIHADNVQAWMAEIEDSEAVFTYATARDRSRIGFIVNFRRHQRVDKPQGAKLPPPNWRDPAVVEVFARRDGWMCPICQEPLDDPNSTPDQNSFHWNSGRATGMVAEKAKTRSDDPTNIRVVHARCARKKPQAAAPMQQSIDEFLEPSETDPGLFPDPSATDMEGKGYGREGEVEVDGNARATRGRPRRPQTEAPDDFEITPSLAQAALQEHGFDRARVELEKKKFLNHHRAKGSKFSDWTHAFRNWLIKAKEFEGSSSRTASGAHQGWRNPDNPDDAYSGTF